MPTLTVTNIFAPNTLIQAGQANQNFTDVVSWANTNVIQKDASVAFTATPAGPASDPVSDNQFARKAYVDKQKVLARQILTVPNGPHSGDVTSDFVLAGVAADAVRLYTINLLSQYDVSSASEWRIHVFEDGAQIARFLINYDVSPRVMFARMLWLPSTGAKTLDIRLDEISGTATFTFSASATVPRQFWVEDVGLR